MLQIEQIATSELSKYSGNARIHTEEQVRKIADGKMAIINDVMREINRH